MRTVLAAVAVVFLAAGMAQAQERRGPSFPTQDDLKTKVGFDEEQLKKSEPIVTEYTTKIKDAVEKAKDAQDKKAAYGEIRNIRTEGMNKLKEICKDDEQKKKLDEAFPAKKKKSDNQ